MDLSVKLPGVCRDSLFFVDTEFKPSGGEEGLYSVQVAVYSKQTKRTTSLHLVSTFNPEIQPTAEQIVRDFHEFLRINGMPTLIFWDARQDVKMLKL